MSFEHGCFISHVHATERLMTEFVDGLAEALRSELEPLIGGSVYIDEDRLKPGFKFNPALARGICASACWIMVYVPQYSEHEYCLRELRAMQLLEKRRREDLGDLIAPHQGMIIPVILRGELSQLPDGIGSEYHALDFKKFSTATGKILRNSSYMEKIHDVAQHIGTMYGLGKDLSHDCRRFEIPHLNGDLGFSPPRQRFPGHTDVQGDGDR